MKIGVSELSIDTIVADMDMPLTVSLANLSSDFIRCLLIANHHHTNAMFHTQMLIRISLRNVDERRF